MAAGPEEVLLYLILILVGAKVGGEAASRLKQPPVVGEILVGVLLGPSLLGWIPPFEILETARRSLEAGATVGLEDFSTALDLHVLAVLAELGVLLLLFEVGLETSLTEFRRVGISASLVGTYGVLFSLVAGAGGSYLLATQMDWVLTPNALAQPNLMHVFVGAVLTATSVGITARVLKDLGKTQTREAQIILGGAVLDDVLGLIVLAIVGGLVLDPGSLTGLGVARTFAVALGFFFAAIILGVLLAPRLINLVHRASGTPFIHLGFAVIFMLIVSYLASLVGLATIVGAFAAGLALSNSEHRHVIFEHVRPVGSIFIGIFFVTLGSRVDLSQVTTDVLPAVLIAGLLLTGVGIVAKLMAGLGVVRTKASRYIVGVGMVPRGEVGLIFALFGLEHALLTNWQYSTVILVVLLTTLITPLWLKALAGRFEPSKTAEPPLVAEAMNP